jgi:hypothetical protein
MFVISEKISIKVAFPIWKFSQFYGPVYKTTASLREVVAKKSSSNRVIFGEFTQTVLRYR